MPKFWLTPGFLLLIGFTATAQKETLPVRNIILVHGAWADGSGWKGVYDILVNGGYKVSIVQEPETSFKEDVAATRRAIFQQEGRCVVVAHSYGGAVITEAANDPKVLGLVYIAAHMPDTGEKESEDTKRFPSDLVKSGRGKENSQRLHIYRPGAVPRTVRRRSSSGTGRVHGSVPSSELRRQLLSDDYERGVADETELDGGSGK